MKVVLLSPHSTSCRNSGDRIRSQALASGLRDRGITASIVAPSYAVGNLGGFGNPYDGPEEFERLVGTFSTSFDKLKWQVSLRARRLWDPYPAVRSAAVRRCWSAPRLGVDVLDIQHSYMPVIQWPAVPTVLTIHNVLANPSFASWGPMKRRVAVRHERAALEAATRLVVFSSAEAARVKEFYPEMSKKVRVVPIGHPAETFYRYAPVHAHRDFSTCVFVGSMDYGPNFAAASWLIRRWPSIRSATGLRTLLIVGRAASRLRSLSPSVDVEIKSDVSDIQPYLARADCSILPILEGGGVRMKVLELMAAGVPIIATKLAVDGVGLEDVRGVEIFDLNRGDDIIRALRVVRHDGVRASMSLNAHDLWGKIYGPARMVDEMIAVYQELGK